jgi:hypothetical protein
VTVTPPQWPLKAPIAMPKRLRDAEKHL